MERSIRSSKFIKKIDKLKDAPNKNQLKHG